MTIEDNKIHIIKIRYEPIDNEMEQKLFDAIVNLVDRTLGSKINHSVFMDVDKVENMDKEDSHETSVSS